MDKFKFLRKRYFSLLETLIAFTLLSLLLTLVFGFFKELSHLSQLSEKKAQASFQMRYTENRLWYIFQRLNNENSTTKRKFYFYTQAAQTFSNMPSLVFTFDNEARANPTFAGDLVALLYVNDEYQLRLATWSLYASQPHQAMHEEILLENVAGMDFKFYAAPAHLTNNGAIIPISNAANQKQPAPGIWHSEWLKEYQQMPVIMQLNITKDKDKDKDRIEKIEGANDSSKENKITYQFVLPSSKNPIQYPLN